MPIEAVSDVEDYTSPVGIKTQTQIAIALLEGENIPLDVIEENPVVSDIFSQSALEYNELGIDREVVERISQGELLTLSQNDRIKVLDVLFKALSLENYTWQNLHSSLHQLQTLYHQCSKLAYFD